MAYDFKMSIKMFIWIFSFSVNDGGMGDLAFVQQQLCLLDILNLVPFFNFPGSSQLNFLSHFESLMFMYIEQKWMWEQERDRDTNCCQLLPPNALGNSSFPRAVMGRGKRDYANATPCTWKGTLRMGINSTNILKNLFTEPNIWFCGLCFILICFLFL